MLLFHLVSPLVYVSTVLAANPLSPPILEHIFTVQSNLASALNPISIPGGVRVVEPIANGTISGPYINGNITGGVAYPSVIYNQTIQLPEINVWGVTNDGEPFFVKESGVGFPTQQLTQIELEIGGNYSHFVTSYIIGVLAPNTNHTTVTAEGWNVTFPS